MTEQYLIRKEEFSGYTDIELNPETCSALKPETLEIKAYDESGEETWVEILNIMVLGDPQLSDFDGCSNVSNRGTSWFFKEEKDTNFKTIGSREGQGLYIYLSSNRKATVYIKLKGRVASQKEIGR